MGGTEWAQRARRGPRPASLKQQDASSRALRQSRDDSFHLKTLPTHAASTRVGCTKLERELPQGPGKGGRIP